ncbi:MAG: hypothetical protein ACI4D8_03655 [Wujia sp.]
MSKHLKFDRLDNTANMFPVIASESVSNVYRVAVTLTENIDGNILQEALDKVLPYFDVFKVKLRKGLFWYYFEENLRPAPRVHEENTFPCEYINPYTNNEYLFRVTYYGRRINLEVFHVLTDGNGALMFLKELVYQYLRLVHPELKEIHTDNLQADSTMDKQDSYVKNYKKAAKKPYKTGKGLILKGDSFYDNELGVIHGYLNLEDIKRVAKGYGVTINQYLLGTLTWAIYQEYLGGMPSKVPIRSSVPVNLRPYFNSTTTKNFFAVVTSVFQPEKENYTFEEVLGEVAECLKQQINKENLGKILDYNVSNEKKLVLRAIPLFIKNIAMKAIYNASAKSSTMTVTNLGVISTAKEYSEYIEGFYAMLSMSKGQNIKAAVCSYRDRLVFTLSATIKETDIQKCFFRKCVEDGIEVSIETNGVYY